MLILQLNALYFVRITLQETAFDLLEKYTYFEAEKKCRVKFDFLFYSWFTLAEEDTKL